MSQNTSEDEVSVVDIEMGAYGGTISSPRNISNEDNENFGVDLDNGNEETYSLIQSGSDVLLPTHPTAVQADGADYGQDNNGVSITLGALLMILLFVLPASIEHFLRPRAILARSLTLQLPKTNRSPRIVNLEEIMTIGTGTNHGP
jgi:hypothetical protein